MIRSRGGSGIARRVSGERSARRKGRFGALFATTSSRLPVLAALVLWGVVTLCVVLGGVLSGVLWGGGGSGEGFEGETKRAYVTVLFSESYVLPTRVLGASLREEGVKQPLVALVFADGPVSAKGRAAMRADGIDVREVESEGYLTQAPESAGPVHGWTLPSGWHPKYLKLAAWAQSDFDQVTFLDADTQLTGDPNGVFEDCEERRGGIGDVGKGSSSSIASSSWVCGVVNPGIAGKVHEGFSMRGREYLNAGVLVLEPSQSNFDALRKLVPSLGDNHFPVDQDFLNQAWEELGWDVTPVAGNEVVHLHGSRDVRHFLGGKPWFWWTFPVAPPTFLHAPVDVVWGASWDPDYHWLRLSAKGPRGHWDDGDGGVWGTVGLWVAVFGLSALSASCLCPSPSSSSLPSALSPPEARGLALGSVGGALGFQAVFWATVHRWHLSPSNWLSSTQHPLLAWLCVFSWESTTAFLLTLLCIGITVAYDRGIASLLHHPNSHPTSAIPSLLWNAARAGVQRAASLSPILAVGALIATLLTTYLYAAAQFFAVLLSRPRINLLRPPLPNQLLTIPLWVLPHAGSILASLAALSAAAMILGKHTPAQRQRGALGM